MKNTLIILISCFLMSQTLWSQHHEYINSKLRAFYAHDLMKSTNTILKLNPANKKEGGEIANAFWQDMSNKDMRKFLNKLMLPPNKGGDARLQEVSRGILSITDKVVELYLFNDKGEHTAIDRSWDYCTFCKTGEQNLQSWPCATTLKNNATHAGHIGLGNHFLSVSSTNRIDVFHDELYRYETFVHELTHTQFDLKLETSLGALGMYGDDGKHYTNEMIPSKNSAFNEAIANAFAMRYHKASGWWTKKPKTYGIRPAQGGVATNASTPPNKPLPPTPDANPSSPPNKPLPPTPDEVAIRDKPLPPTPDEARASNGKPTIGRRNNSYKNAIPPAPIAEFERDMQTGATRLADYKENWDFISWLNNPNKVLFADVNNACSTDPSNPNCLVNRLADLQIPTAERNIGGQAVKIYRILEIPPEILIHNEVLQTNIFADFMTVFQSTSIMTKAVENALLKVQTAQRGRTQNSMFGLVFKEMVRQADAYKNRSNSKHDGRYMPLALLDFYTGFKINDKATLERVIGEKWNADDINIDEYWTVFLPVLQQNWVQNGKVWDRALLVKAAQGMNINPVISIGSHRKK